jgi:hypothetical protein
MSQSIIKWNFSCGHEATQYFAGANPPSNATRNSTLMCPACAENDIQAQKLIREQEDLDRKKEEAARGQEKNAVTLYQAQATFMTKQMEDAGGDEEFRTECKKMLENCKILWAGKVRTAESKGENEQSEVPSAGSLIELWAAKIKSADEKLCLLLDATRILRDQEEGTRRSDLYNELVRRCRGWSKIQTSIQALGKKIGEDTMLKQLDELEKMFAKEWKRAIELMKEDKK